MKQYPNNEYDTPSLRSLSSTILDPSSTCCEPSSPRTATTATTTALVIVDVQPEYWSQCPAVQKDFPNFPSKIASLIDHCRSQNMKCIWVRADYSFEHSPWLHQFSRLHQGRIPPVVKPSSKWEDFATPLPHEQVVTKRSWNATSGTNLLQVLHESNIDTVLVCGLITSVCVQHSAFGIFEAGFRTVLVTDACADRGMARHEAALLLYGNYMYESRTTESIIIQEQQQQQDFLVRKEEETEKDCRPTTSSQQQQEEYYCPSAVFKTKMAPAFGKNNGDNDDDDDNCCMDTLSTRTASLSSMDSFTNSSNTEEEEDELQGSSTRTTISSSSSSDLGYHYFYEDEEGLQENASSPPSDVGSRQTTFPSPPTGVAAMIKI